MKVISTVLFLTIGVLVALYLVACNKEKAANNKGSVVVEKSNVSDKLDENFKRISNSSSGESKVSWYLIDKGLDNAELFKVSIKILSKDRTPRIYIVNDEKMFDKASKILKKESDGIDGMPHEYMQRYIVVYIDKSADGKHIVFSGRSLYASNKLVLGKI